MNLKEEYGWKTTLSFDCSTEKNSCEGLTDRVQGRTGSVIVLKKLKDMQVQAKLEKGF